MTIEIKQEIARIVDQLPDQMLGDLLHYLRQVEKTTAEKMRTSLQLSTILTEDRDIKKLAQ